MAPKPDKASGIARRRAARTSDKKNRESSTIAEEDLDRVIHEPMRLRIMSALACSEKATFSELRELLATTDGNLSVHARKLEEAGYLVASKAFENRLPKTTYTVTAAGRRALEAYLSAMESIINATRRGEA